MKQRLILKTKRDYIKAHKLLWNGIIEHLRLHGADIIHEFDATPEFKQYIIKQYIIKQIWNTRKEIPGCCFGCAWAHKQRHGYEYEKDFCNKCCLFTILPQESCLNGLWNRFCYLFNNDNIDNMIIIATKIRDFPVRKK
jgi:hypothetical protein